MNMSLTTVLIIIVIGLFTGLLAGMLGIGGGLIVIPALILVLGFSQHEAQGTSLAMMLPPIGIVAAWNYYKAGHVDLKVALILALAFIAGSVFGSKIAIGLSENVLKKIFSIFLVLVGLKMLLWK